LNSSCPTAAVKLLPPLRQSITSATLAVLRGEDDKFLDNFNPFELTDAKVGDTINIWQLENTGVVLATADR
jgi:hypothetical protein